MIRRSAAFALLHPSFKLRTFVDGDADHHEDGDGDDESYRESDSETFQRGHGEKPIDRNCMDHMIELKPHLLPTAQASCNGLL